MKEIKRTRTIEEVTGYEAFDGKLFDNMEECKKYEDTAYGVLGKELRKLMVNGDEFGECQIWEDYGYGSEEFYMAVLDIKTEEDLFLANRYFELVGRGTELIDKKFIGKRILVSMGYTYDRQIAPYPRTKEELMEQFEKNLDEFFMTQEEREAKKGEEV